MIHTALFVAAMQQTTLSGVVRDSVDLEPIAFAQVTVTAVAREAKAASGVSDRFGAFVVPSAPGGGAVRVDVASYGYAAWTRSYETLPSEPVRVLLSPVPITGTFPLLKPWPSFGVEGTGVYGYFDGLTPSGAVPVRIR